MADRISREHRSWNMSRIRSKDTNPEKIVRSLLHRAGLRFTLHQKLPGRPDIVLPRHGAVVFVHGCFWHRHRGCRFAYNPKSNLKFWTTKFQSNIERDIRSKAALRKLGWRVYTVWECEIARNPEAVADRLIRRIGK